MLTITPWNHLILVFYIFDDFQGVVSYETNYLTLETKNCKKNRFHRDLNSDRWIQSPKCLPLHHGTSCLINFLWLFLLCKCLLNFIINYIKKRRKNVGSTETWTRIAGFKVQSAYHYTMEPLVFNNFVSISQLSNLHSRFRVAVASRLPRKSPILSRFRLFFNLRSTYLLRFSISFFKLLSKFFYKKIALVLKIYI